MTTRRMNWYKLNGDYSCLVFLQFFYRHQRNCLQTINLMQDIDVAYSPTGIY